jgi:hypothetical protein
MQHVLKMQYISLFPKYKGAENSMPKLREVIGGTKKKNLSSNCMSDMRPCSAIDHQSESDVSWKLGKTTEV